MKRAGRMKTNKKKLFRFKQGRTTGKTVISKAKVKSLTGNRIKVNSVRYIRKVMLLCACAAGAGLLLMGTQADAAEETGQFHSRGAIHYTDSDGQEILLDAQDFQVLFQYAAEAKGGLSQALSGVGTKLIEEGQNYRYTRDPGVEASAGRLQTAEQLQAAGFDLLLQALSESQKLPDGYEENYTLACSDNLTLGRAAWADGSLARGNNRDLMEHYIRGWLEGSGCTDYEGIYDEEGRWIGYREKQN